MNYNLIAKCVDNIDYYHKKTIKGLTIGEDYNVSYIDMGQSSTSIYLDEFTNTSFNSILFDFYENGDELDIATSIMQVSSYIKELGEDGFGVVTFMNDAIVTRREYRKTPCYVVYKDKNLNKS